MTVPEMLAKLAGAWNGTSRLWLSPGEPARESASTASVALVANGKFLVIRYTWTEEGPQEGLILLPVQARGDRVGAAWLDSWHMGNAMMSCNGVVQVEAGVSMKGSYAVSAGADWGWRIVVAPRSSDEFRLTMFNVTPEGEEQLAVEADYERDGLARTLPTHLGGRLG